MAANYWLKQQLEAKKGLSVTESSDLIIVKTAKGLTYSIYSPDSHEYIITTDIVDKAKAMGANVISYASSWCRAAEEAVASGAKKGVRVVPHATTFKLVTSK